MCYFLNWFSLGFGFLKISTELILTVQESSYAERAERLIGEVKEIFNSLSMAEGELVRSPLNDLLQRLLMVDNVERLGIGRHFQNQIKAALQYVYRSVLTPFKLLFMFMFYDEYTRLNPEIILASSYWSSDNGIGCGRDSVYTDLNATALGFRILRLHGYTVFPGIQLLLINPSFNFYKDIIRSQLASSCRY